jgi:hypothetical protein
MADLESIQKTVCDIDLKVDGILQRMATSDERSLNQAAAIEGLKHTCYGANGQSGLCKQVNEHAESIKALMAVKGFWSVAAREILVAVVVAAIAFFMFLYKTHAG